MLGYYGYIQNGFVIAGVAISATFLAITVFFVYYTKQEGLKNATNLAVGMTIGVVFAMIFF